VRAYDPSVRITGLDHVVILAADVERSLAFYLDELGLEGVRVEEWRRGEVFFPSARVNEHTIIDILGPAEHSGTNLDHFCLVFDDVDLHEVAQSGRFEVVDGPDVRFGARGDGLSLYVRDPDGNTVELRTYLEP
jgi:catechol 2,3-dioxygenase-like lactoylglutathione lyase family enzyme